MTTLLTILMAVTLAAADLTGAWTLRLMPDFGGEEDSVECRFTRQQGNLSIDCGDGPNIAGEVSGARVTFRMKTGPRNELTATFEGTLDQEETTLTGTWRLEMREGKFVARKHS